MSNFLDRVLDSVLGGGTAVNLTEIYANIEESRAVLKKMQGEVETVRAQKGSLQELSAATKDCWQGLSGDALREKLAALIKEQEAIASDLEQGTAMMLQTLQQLEDADETLAYIFRQAGSSGISGSGAGRRG